MTRTDRPLDNPINWSFRVGRLFGISVRVHIAFLLCAVVLLWMQLPASGSLETRSFGSMFVDALGMYAILFGIVFLHELGHCFGARVTGGSADEILLWPLGGLAYVNPRHDAAAHMVTAVSGPMVNVAICLVCSVFLVIATGSLGAVPWNPLHPMQPMDPEILPVGPLYWVTVVYGISYFLLLVNLLPIFPFDGGRILQAWLWTSKGYRSSLEIAAGAGMVGAILIGLFALFTGQPWILLLIAVFGYMNCWQTRRMLRESDYTLGTGVGMDFSDGYKFLEDGEQPRKPGFFARRRTRKAAEREERQRQQEAERRTVVDDILRKVAQTGIASLNARERRILEEETHRRRGD